MLDNTIIIVLEAVDASVQSPTARKFILTSHLHLPKALIRPKMTFAFFEQYYMIKL